MSVKVFLADDHPIVRQGIRGMLEREPDFQVIAESGDGIETLNLVEKLKPDVLIVDLMMPGLNGLEITRQVTSRHPRLRVIVLSMHTDEAYIRQSLKNGASGYVVKDSLPQELATAVRSVLKGQRYLNPNVMERMLNANAYKVDLQQPVDSYDRLTDREKEVLHLVIEGNTSVEIGRRLSISARTAESHRANLMHKLGLNSQIDLFRFAVKKGLIQLD